MWELKGRYLPVLALTAHFQQKDCRIIPDVLLQVITAWACFVGFQRKEEKHYSNNSSPYEHLPGSQENQVFSTKHSHCCVNVSALHSSRSLHVSFSSCSKQNSLRSSLIVKWLPWWFDGIQGVCDSLQQQVFCSLNAWGRRGEGEQFTRLSCALELQLPFLKNCFIF